MRRKIGAICSAVALSAVMVGGAMSPASAAKFKDCADDPPPNANASFTQEQTAQCDSSGTGVEGDLNNSAGNAVQGQR